ncbi:hypothetical protein CEXT_690521 [Caerostris extrusa]|uniref:Uncharacterized protein n=1 Tax=Caerostris extrusa TaxID=172846 RepID=A0AAV4MLD2_CAEEX|nr:hypothetical protein CEXT_690521 [Caerostris extrusa]
MILYKRSIDFYIFHKNVPVIGGKLGKTSVITTCICWKEINLSAFSTAANEESGLCRAFFPPLLYQVSSHCVLGRDVSCHLRTVKDVFYLKHPCVCRSKKSYAILFHCYGLFRPPVPIASLISWWYPTSLLRVFEVFLNRRRPVGHPSCSWRDCDKMVITVGLPNISIARCAPYLCFFCNAAPLLSGPRSCDARGHRVRGSVRGVVSSVYFLKGFS